MSSQNVSDLIDLQDELKTYTQEFRLWPKGWGKINDIGDLNWITVKFDEEGLEKVPNKPGIYSIVINPGVTNHPNRYLCYIGKTERPLKVRIKEYLLEAKSSKGRPAIIRVLNKWNEYIEISLVEIEKEKIDELEKKLNDAFIPPFQKKFTAEVNKIVNAF